MSMSLPTPSASPAQPSASILPFNERAGLIFVTEGSFFSGVAVVSVLGYIAFKAFQLRAYKNSGANDSADIHHYFLSLMVAELVMAVGGVMSAEWVVQAQVLEGTLCTAQAVLKQIGNVGVALTSLAIAVHTFCVLALRWRAPAVVSYVVIALIWAFLVLIVLIGWGMHRSSDPPYFGPAGKWCWITDGYNAERIALEYFWLWFTAFMDIIIYIFLALVMSGFIVVEPGKMRFRNKSERKQDRGQITPEADKEARQVAKSLLFYPLVYIISVFPQSISRWLYFSGDHVPFGAVAACSTLFQLSGVFNVALFVLTRPKVIAKSKPDVESLDDGKDANGTNKTWSEEASSPRVEHLDAYSRGARSEGGLGRLGDDESEGGFRFDDDRQTSSRQ